MPLQSALFSGNAYLQRTASGALTLFTGASTNETAAVQLIQRALVTLGYQLPKSFKGTAVPDGLYGSETAEAVRSFQKLAFPGQPREWDGRVGKKTLALLDTQIFRHGSNPGPSPSPAPVANFVCGPDVTEQVKVAWSKIQTEFTIRQRAEKIRMCNKILLPVKDPAGLVKEVIASLSLNQKPNLPALMAKVREHADIDGWDLLPLYQGASQWLRTPPVFDPGTNGPFATPSSSDYSNLDQFASGHEDENTCSNTVQVAGKCWLNGSVNYGTFGIMVKSCSEFAANDRILPSLSSNPFDQPLKFNPVVRGIYSLFWAKMLIRAYKRFGNNPEGAVVPEAWTEATFNGGPAGTPAIPGNRPKCQCRGGCTGSIVSWDYVWEPIKTRGTATPP